MVERRPDRAKGPNHDAFWAWCAKGELRLQSCTTCGHIAWPIVDICEHCGSDELVWTAMFGRGKVISWCQFAYDYYRGMLPVPYDTILVALEEGPLFTSNPKGFGYDEVTFEMTVKLAFIDCEDAAGQFRLPVFEKT